jgi:protein gp37
MLSLWSGQAEGDLRFHENRLHWPLRDLEKGKVRRYFVGNMTDIFNPLHDPWHLRRVFHVMNEAPEHTYMILTKRPAGALDYNIWYRDHESPPAVSPWPIDSTWFGITGENQRRYDERTQDLAQIQAAIKFVSLEPLLGPIDLGSAAKWLDWVIVGGETGPGARPMHPGWVRSLRDQCVAAGIPFWFKSWGAWFFEGRPVNPNDPAVRIINLAGGHGFHGQDAIHVRRQRNTGRFLDDREWSELPEVKA